MARRELHEPGRFHHWACIFAEKKFPNATLQELKTVYAFNPEIVARTRFELNVADYARKMYENHHGNFTHETCMRVSKEYLSLIPKEMMVNVEEYLDGKEFTAIPLYGYTVPEILKWAQKHPLVTFERIVECYAYWNRIGYENDPNYLPIFFSHM